MRPRDCRCPPASIPVWPASVRQDGLRHASRRSRMTGWSNFNGVTLEAERRYSKGFGFQFFYNFGNAFRGGRPRSGAPPCADTNQFLPGAVPTDYDERNRFLNYQRDTDIPKHRVRWNWIVDLPFGKGKTLAGNAERRAGQVHRRLAAGRAWVAAQHVVHPAHRHLSRTATTIEMYGYQYPIQDCRSGACCPGYLWWNGYIPANRINSYDAARQAQRRHGRAVQLQARGAATDPVARQARQQRPAVHLLRDQHRWVPLKNGPSQRTIVQRQPAPLAEPVHARRAAVGSGRFAVQDHPDHRAVQCCASTRTSFNVLNHPGNPNSIGERRGAEHARQRPGRPGTATHAAADLVVQAVGG